MLNQQPAITEGIRPMTIAEKLSKNEPLDPQETQRLDMALRNLDTLGSWIGTDGNPNFKNMYTDYGDFGISPIKGVVILAYNSDVATGTTEDMILAFYQNVSTGVIQRLPGDDTLTKFIVNPLYGQRADVSFTMVGDRKAYDLNGGVHDFTGAESATVLLKHYLRADDSLLGTTPIHDAGGLGPNILVYWGISRASNGWGGYAYSDIYFKFVASHSLANGASIQMLASTFRLR
jgi:hypothetical protein